MLKNALALEGLGSGSDDTENMIDVEHAAVIQEFAEVSANRDVISETQGMSNAIGSVAEVVHGGVVSEQGIDTPTALVLEAAMEHFRLRLSVPKSSMPAMESYEQNRLVSSRQAYGELIHLNERIQVKLKVAQENFASRAINAIRRAFTSNETMLNEIADLRIEHLNDPHSIGKPAWGRVFSRTGKPKAGGTEVLQVVAAYVKMANDPALVKYVNLVTTSVHDINMHLDKTVFIANDEAVRKIKEVGDNLAAACENFEKILSPLHSAVVTDVEIETCDVNHFKRIAIAVRDFAGSSPLDEAFERLNSAFCSYIDRVFDGGARLAGAWAKDIAAADREINKIIDKMDSGGMDIFQERSHIIHGCYKYLLASMR